MVIWLTRPNDVSDDYDAPPADHDERREQMVRRHAGLVHALVARYSHRGELTEDLLQVGMLGLLNAIDRFDPERGVDFTSFARPTVEGELKRYFRDKRWAVRVPRGTKELALQVIGLESELAQELGRSPTVIELAARAGVAEEDVIEALEATHSYTASSLDAPPRSVEGDEVSLSDIIGGPDRELEKLDALVSIAPEIAKLSRFEQEVLYLRFFKGMVQSEIGARLGVSQMQISRTLSRTLTHLRARLDPDGV